MLQLQYLGLSNLNCTQGRKLYLEQNNLSYQIKWDTSFELCQKYYLPTCSRTAEILSILMLVGSQVRSSWDSNFDLYNCYSTKQTMGHISKINLQGFVIPFYTCFTISVSMTCKSKTITKNNKVQPQSCSYIFYSHFNLIEHCQRDAWVMTIWDISPWQNNNILNKTISAICWKELDTFNSIFPLFPLWILWNNLVQEKS